MSSLRNAVKRVTHKERSQPQSRAKLGILEKKKDYRLRARDYHDKEDRINAMRRRASMRNPDEFYFGMHRSEVVDGRHRKREEVRRAEMEDVFGPDAIRIMKDQDLSYVRMQRQRDEKKVEKMRANLQFLGVDGKESGSSSRNKDAGARTLNKKRKHTIFMEGADEAERFDVAEHFDTFPELAGREFNRPRVETLRKSATAAAGYGILDEDAKDVDEEEAKQEPTQKELAKRAKVAKRTAKKVARARASAYGEMEARANRAAEMHVAEAHLVTEKLLTGKGRRRKIKGAEDGKPAVYKWRRKRKG